MVVAVVVDGNVEVKWSISTVRCLYRGLHYMTQLALASNRGGPGDEKSINAIRL